MLMRISGGTEGIREYLETGRKADWEWSRDELDTRVPLAGDLDFVDRVISRMQGSGEKYLHITLSFREDEISQETLEAITEDFRAFAFSAYDSDEYAFYAEAHLPRRTSYTHAQTGKPVERKPHVHIVVPEVNLLTGRGLNPFGRVEQQTAFLEAFQEHVNAKYGLASPKDFRRAELTPASELISRYKGDVFKGPGHDLKAELLDTMLARNVQTVEAFDALLVEHGAVRTRNAGRANEYRNVTPAGAGKGVNLKEYLFSREFIELPTVEKRARLSREASAHYETAQASRPTPADYAARLDDWRDRRSLEIKYLNSGNRKAYQAYRAATPEQQRATLAERRAAFYSKHRKDWPDREPPGAPQAQILHLAYQHALADAERPAARTLGELRTLDQVKALPGDRGAAAAVDPPALVPPVEDRQPNSVIQRYAVELHERREAQAADRGELDRIKRELDARRLLDHLSHTHGVIPEKYAVTQGKDGGGRIRCGSRNLNVSDFLTKELNLPWKDAAAILRDCHGRQLGQVATERKDRPRRNLWRDFQAGRPKARDERDAAWKRQLEGEKKRRGGIRTRYLANRGKAQGDRTKRPAERKAAVSIARMERITAEQALRETIKQERQALGEQFPRLVGDQYTAWLRQRADAGDVEALAELRRCEGFTARREDQATKEPVAELRTPAPSPVAAPVFMPLRYAVARNGDVTYSDRQGDVLRDGSDRVAILRQDDQAVSLALRLAQQKFYDPAKDRDLTVISVGVSSRPEFRRQAVEVAVREGIRVRFADADMEKHRLELIAKAKQVEKAPPGREGKGQTTPAKQPERKGGKSTKGKGIVR